MEIFILTDFQVFVRPIERLYQTVHFRHQKGMTAGLMDRLTVKQALPKLQIRLHISKSLKVL